MRLLLIALFFLMPVGAMAQDTQVALTFVSRVQSRLGYLPNNYGAKVEGDYELNEKWVVLAHITGLHTPKRDSGTGNSVFAASGARWTPIRVGGVGIFGEFDLTGGYLSTALYSKGVLHFRNAVGVRLLEDRLLLAAGRLYQDMLPDAAKFLKEQGFDPESLKATFNQLSAWQGHVEYWTKPIHRESKWGLKVVFRYDSSKFVDAFERKRTGWMIQYEFGPYRKL